MTQLQEKQERSLVSLVQRMRGPNLPASFSAAPEEGGGAAEPPRVILRDGYERQTPVQPYRYVPRRGIWWKALLALALTAVVVLTALKLIGWI